MKLPTNNRRRSRNWLLAAALPCLLAACGGWQPEPVPPLQRTASATETLQRGHDIHLQKCAKCHVFVDPRGFGEADWRGRIMPTMAGKAELTHADSAAVLAYLLEVRKQAPP